MLASGAHIKIGSYEFMLDETVDAGTAVGNLYRPHYKWQEINLFGAGETIPGSSKQNFRAARLLWLDDFSGGEGNRVWYPDDPTVYDFSLGLNPRIRGQLTGRPTRARDSMSGAVVANDTTKPLYFGVATGQLFACGGRNAYYWGGSSWTDVTATMNIGAGYYVTAVGSDPNRVLVGYTNGTNRGILALNKSNRKDPNPSGTGNRFVMALGSLHGYIYSLEWDAAQTVRLYRYDVSNGYDYNSSTNPIAAKAVTGTSIMLESGGDYSETNYQASWFGGLTVANDSVFYFVSTPGHSRIFEVGFTTGAAPIWAAPDGFTIRDIEFHNGYLYIVGHWGQVANAGFGAVFVFDRKTGDVIPVVEPGRTRGLNSTLSVNGASYMNQSILADGSNGRIWVYDADEDALTMLDSIGTTGGDSVAATDATTFTTGTHQITDLATFNATRFVAIGGSGANYQILRYSNDEPANRQAGTATNNSSATLTSGIWDWGLPFNQKQLAGFDVVFAPLTTGQTIQVEYDPDGSGFLTAGSLTSASPDAAKGRSFIALTSAQNFTTLRVRLTLTATNGNLPPIVYGIAAEAQATQQVWELIIRLKDYQTGTRGSKSAAMLNGDAARDFLRSAITSGFPVTFIDGYRYQRKGGANFSTHTVTVEDPEDIVIRGAEGSMRVVLREV